MENGLPKLQEACRAFKVRVHIKQRNNEGSSDAHSLGHELPFCFIWVCHWILCHPHTMDRTTQPGTWHARVR